MGDKSTFKGVCSNYLADIAKGEKVQAFIRPSTFRLPSDASKPIVMIGPGTGIAPMRALLQERSYQKKKLKVKVGSNILYFGCKKKAHGQPGPDGRWRGGERNPRRRGRRGRHRHRSPSRYRWYGQRRTGKAQPGWRRTWRAC